MTEKKLFLFDVMPLLYRAHFATMGKSFGTTTGIDTRTTLVFFNYIFQVLTEEKPDAVASVLDSKAKERVAVASTYKANREKMPNEIYDAFPYAMQLMDSLQIPILKEEGYEADDVIASMARKGELEGYKVFIVSPDKDFAQLVNENIFLLRPPYKGVAMEVLNVEGVINKYGVRPDQIADFLALRGDSVDNIQGIKGIGDKTATSLLATFTSIENLIDKVESISQVKVKESIKAYQHQLVENKFLALLTGDLEVTFTWEEITSKKPNEEKLLPLLDELQFVKIRERLIKQGFISNNDAIIIKENKATEVQVQLITPEEAKQRIDYKKEIAITYSEQWPEILFVMQHGSTSLLGIVLNSEQEWAAFITDLDHADVHKIGWQLKPLLKKIALLNLVLKSLWIDMAIAAYLLQPDAKIEWVFIKDKYELPEYHVAAPYSTLNFLPSLTESYDKIIDRIKQLQIENLFYEIELPLQSVLCRMEMQGIAIDLGALGEIDLVLTEQLKLLEKNLYEMAGATFNINSPSKTAEIIQQIADPSELKKTKTGQISTAEPYLIDLAPKYPFIADLLNYRKLNKIITTYVYSLPKYVDAQTGKIHPTFQQIVAGTGRLSCTEPNLQNLPIRSEAGREVRKAIVPSGPGFTVLSIDYNQVELRLLAALSEDKVMIETFRLGNDIHTATASRVFRVEEDKVDKDMRSKAKGINFGIAYGITPWGLATRLKISQKESKQIIDAYFQEFSSVKEYLEKSIRESRERGYTRTRYGRIRYIEGIDSRNGTTRKMAERMAVNAPLQGLAADIIKEAMVSVDEFIIRNSLKTRLILQVHDELVFDAAVDELEKFVPEVVKIMEDKAGLIVPLKVNVTTGRNWLEQEKYKSHLQV